MILRFKNRTLLCLIVLLVAATMEFSQAAEPVGITAVRTTDFLNSIGVCSAISRRGENLSDTARAAKYLGLRWFRAGYESGIPIADLIELHNQTGVCFSYGLMSGGTDIARLLNGARQLASAGALLAFEGNNEPNNWGITYQGQAGGRNRTWLPVAKLQRDLYQAVKSDPVLKEYPVWSITEGGAETDNVGLQYLTIPNGAETLMPAGTKYADYANVHNYIYHPNTPGLEDNKTWKASDPTSACKVDGLYGEYGVTWRRHFPGYAGADLMNLPRVTTETGALIGGAITEEVQALNLLSLYLDQFKRGWRYTAVYLLRDRVDEAGNQKFGFYRPDYTPRKAALYLHNLTTILDDRGSLAKPGKLAYAIPDEPATVHDLLLQKSDGTFQLVVWSELIKGTNNVTVNLSGTDGPIKVYDPTVATNPIQTHNSTRSLPLILTDHPVVITLTKASAQTAPPAARPPFMSHWIDRDPTWLTSVHQVVLADLDGDGDLDWTVGNVHGNPNLYWYEYQGPDTWVKHLIASGPAIADVYGGIAALDVNLDGNIDLISGPFLFLNGGQGASWKMFNIKTAGPACHDHQAVDINGDGKLDILSTSADTGRISWYEAPTDPTQPWTEHFIGKAPEGYSKFHASTHPEAAANLDGDGDLDVVVALGWFENVAGKGLVWKPHWNKLMGVEGTYNVGVKTACRDLDGDGDIDIVQSECDTRTPVKIAWLENDSQGNFTRYIIKEGLKEDYHSLQVFDYDNDGDLDVLTAIGPLADPSLPKNVLLFENTAGPSKKPVFTEHVLLTLPGDSPHELCIGDVDRDGDIDIIVKGWDKPSPFIYLENRTKQTKP